MARIGIDLDGTVYPFAEEMQKFVSEALGASLPAFTDWDTHSVHWGLTNEQFQDLMVEAMDLGYLWQTGAPAEGFTKALWDLSDAGHTIVIVTDRLQDTTHGRRAAAATRAWLRKVGANYDELHFASDKTQFDCDFFVEDKPQAVPSLRLAGVDAVYMTRPWNAEFPCPRVNSWPEFVKYVESRVNVQAG